MDAGEGRVDKAALPDPEEQPGRGDEVAVEDLQQRQERGEDDDARDDGRAEGALEGGLGAEMPRDELLPGKDVRRHGHNRRVEDDPDGAGEYDRAAEVARIEAGPRLLRFLADRLEAGHEVRNDLQDEQDREPGAARAGVREERLPVGGVSPRETQDGEGGEDREKPEGRHVLEDRAR